MTTSNDGVNEWNERTGILNIPTRLIRWFSGIFSVTWLILTAVTTYHSVVNGQAATWDALATSLIWAGAPNIGFGLPIAYILTEVIDMVFGSWIRERTRERARREGVEEGKKQGIQEGKEQGIQEGKKQGIRENNARWLSWLERRQQAEANGEEFDEPPPTFSGDLVKGEDNQ